MSPARGRPHARTRGVRAASSSLCDWSSSHVERCIVALQGAILPASGVCGAPATAPWLSLSLCGQPQGGMCVDSPPSSNLRATAAQALPSPVDSIHEWVLVRREAAVSSGSWCRNRPSCRHTMSGTCTSCHQRCQRVPRGTHWGTSTCAHGAQGRPAPPGTACSRYQTRCLLSMRRRCWLCLSLQACTAWQAFCT